MEAQEGQLNRWIHRSIIFLLTDTMNCGFGVARIWKRWLSKCTMESEVTEDEDLRFATEK